MTDSKVPLIELGDTGSRRWSGYTCEDFIPELANSLNSSQVYDEMRRNDGTISGIINTMNNLFHNVGWSFETKGVDNDAENKKRLVESMFDDMEKSFTQVLSDILTYPIYGYSLCEIVWKKRQGKQSDNRFNSRYDDGLWAPRKLPLRSQKTIIRWEFDDSGVPIAAVQQIPQTGKIVTIPLQKLLHFRTTTEQDLPNGISILRGSYESYQFKKKIQRIEAVSLERELSGIPMIRLPSNYMQDEAPPELKQIYKNIKEYAVNIRKNSQAAVVLPSDVDERGNYKFTLDLIKSAGQVQNDTNTIIKRYDSSIARQLMASFVFLGTEGASYNIGEMQISLFSNALNYYLDVVESVINSKLIPQIYENNGWVIDDNIARVSHGRVGTLDFDLLSSAVMKLCQVGALTPEPSLERYLREQGNIPQMGLVEERLV